MSRWILASVGLAVLIGAAQLDLRAEPRPAAQHQVGAADAGATEARALLNRYCVSCHNRRTLTAGLALDTLDVAQVTTNAATWEHVIRRLRANAMPPAGRPRPTDAAAGEFIHWLEGELDRAGLENPDPGRPAVHRLNRAEYANAVRDIFGLEIDVNALLPADDEQEGFDNIAEVLSVSPTLIERYLAAARRISQLVVGDTNVRAVAEVYPIHGAVDQDGVVSDDLPFGSRGGVAVEHHFPVDGEYIIRFSLRKQEYGYVRGLGRPHALDVRLDGERVGGFTVGRDWDQGQRPPMGYAGKFESIYDSTSFPEWELYALHADEGLEVRTPVTAGRHQVGLSFHRRPALPEGILPLPLDRSTYSFGQNEFQEGNPGVSEVQIIGPYNPSGAAALPSRDRLFVCEATGGEAGEERCARTILSNLTRQAYRRPTTTADVDTLLPFYRDGRTEGGFDAGIQAAVERLLVDPEFLFRIETDPPSVPAGTPYRISDLELASRLSFFLWSSIPDDELVDLAAAGRLSEPAVLDGQIERMLADPRSRALVENFAGQWLQLRKLRNATPDTATYTAFDENLREAMWQETELFLENELRDDRPIVNALRANYTFVNERLARHYGISDVHGVHFRRVEYPDDARGGLLGHASLLTITSYANRTSPVVRGVWLLENILGTPPSPPPPNVPSLPSVNEGGTPRSIRERLEQHRSNAICASCHSTIDPLGFALEGFDAIGRRRATNGGGTPFDTGIPINASGTLVDGTEVHGLAGLRNVILGREDQFVETVTEKLLTYALGRTLEHYDMPVVRQISRQTAPGELTWSTLVSSVVKSTPFLMRRSES
jgi:mono/diheme cytochrome c family protein